MTEAVATILENIPQGGVTGFSPEALVRLPTIVKENPTKALQALDEALLDTTHTIENTPVSLTSEALGPTQSESLTVEMQARALTAYQERAFVVDDYRKIIRDKLEHGDAEILPQGLRALDEDGNRVEGLSGELLRRALVLETFFLGERLSHELPSARRYIENEQAMSLFEKVKMKTQRAIGLRADPAKIVSYSAERMSKEYEQFKKVALLAEQQRMHVLEHPQREQIEDAVRPEEEILQRIALGEWSRTHGKILSYWDEYAKVGEGGFGLTVQTAQTVDDILAESEQILPTISQEAHAKALGRYSHWVKSVGSSLLALVRPETRKLNFFNPRAQVMLGVDGGSYTLLESLEPVK